MKKLLLVTSMIAPMLFAFANADEVRNEVVHFPRGASSTTIRGAITGWESVNYRLLAHAGQYLKVRMTTDNASNYFNIFAPGKGPGDEAMFIGAMAADDQGFTGRLPASGEYTVQVFLYRNAARRHEKANYTLEIAIDDHLAQTGESSPAQHAAAE